jgi:hypothetical protein
VSGQLRRRPITQRAARAFVDEHHRHNIAPRGSVFQVALEDEDGNIVAVAIAGRPTARGLDDGRSLEVLRVCTTGHPNAPSMLYGACTRAGVALGYDRERIFTYKLRSEPGTSLIAAGWVQDELLPERSGWDCPSRPRPDDPSPREAKDRWRAA